MKSELLRKALMSKMAVGGNVGNGDDKKKQQESVKSVLTGKGSATPIDDVNKEVSFFKDKQMTPQEWATYAEGQGWKPFHTESTIPIEQQVKLNKYVQYYDPKQYARTETGFSKLADVGKGVDYSKDTTYKPNIQYGLTAPTANVQQPQATSQDTLKFQFIPRVGLYGTQKEQYQLFKNNPEYYKKRIEEFGKLKSEWENQIQNKGMSGGLSRKPIYVKGYSEPAAKAQEAVQISKKKGGIVGRYADGTQPSGIDPNVITDETNMVGGKKVKDISGEDKLNFLNMAAPMAASGLDALDRKDGRSSIAGQTGVGAIKGTSTGLQIGMNPALMAATGGLSAPIGAIAGAVIGGTSGAIRGKKEKKERQDLTNQEGYVKATEAQESTNPNRGAVKLETYNVKDTKGGLAGLFANGGQVKQISNSANKINYAKGGTIKGAGTGTSDSIVTDINKKGIPEGSFITPAKNNEMAKGIRGMVLGQNPNKVAEFKKGGTPKSDKVAVSNGEHLFTPAEKEKITRYLGKEILEKLAPEAEENEMEKNKGGEMIKRADGSYSKRGLWDNIRANAGSGKKPTAEMLKQEKEIIAEKAKGGYVVKRSSERKGKTHVVTGPDGTKKYFGDSNLGQHPNDPARKKAFYARHEKNLKKNPYFRAFARETWAEGGTVGSKMNKEMLKKELLKKANGGNVAVADKTKVKSPNVYEGKMPEKKELVSTLQESRVLKRKDGTSKVEVKMPDGTWKTTYDLQAKAKGGELTKSKAKEILHDKSVHGKPLTDKQRKYMGWVAGGKKNMGGIVGKYAMGGKVNRDWEWG